MVCRLLLLLLCIIFNSPLHAELASGGRGGPFVEYHGTNLEVFDSGISGTPVVIGGVGLGTLSKQFRLGGGGGGGFLWNGTDNLAFGLGYGGVIGEYIITSWFYTRLLIGGGGYAVGKILAQTDTTTTTQKINSGGFILFHPSVFFEVKIGTICHLALSVGYFLPNISKLQTLTVGLNLTFGAKNL